MKYSLAVLLFILITKESKIDINYFNASISEFNSQDETLDPRLVGIWVMVLKFVDGEIEYDESIEKGYTYNFQKNGNYIIDLRALRSAFRNMSIVDLPHFKWQTMDGLLEISAFSSVDGRRAPGSDKKRYYFKGDTLVRSVAEFEYFYVRKSN